MENTKQLIYKEDLIAEYDRVHIGPPGGARKLMEDAPPWMPWKWCMGIGAGKVNSRLVPSAVRMLNGMKRLGRISGSSAPTVEQRWME